MKTPVELRYDKLGPRIVKALERRFFGAWYFSDIPEAVEKIFSFIPKTDIVSWGGSATVTACNLTALAVEKGYKVIDRDKSTILEERLEIMREALLCDTFFTGTNAITEDGQLINIDAYGNRVAAMAFGPRQVIVVAGMNKVVQTEAAALNRARTIAGPINLHRFPNAKSMCNETGACEDCICPDSFCSYIVRTRLCRPKGRIKVILIGKDLGF